MCLNTLHPQKMCVHQRKSNKPTTIKTCDVRVEHVIGSNCAPWFSRTEAPAMALTVDARERALIQQLVKTEVEHNVATLPLGDVCFRSDHCTWLAERKRADDLAQFIKSGRWREQLGRLFDSDVACIVLIFEGDLRNTSISYWSVLGAVVNAELRKNAHVFRTWDRYSATNMVEHLVVVAVMIVVVQLSLSNRNSIRFSNSTRPSTTCSILLSQRELRRF
jgi:ERCC4-type nuclease